MSGTNAIYTTDSNITHNEGKTNARTDFDFTVHLTLTDGNTYDILPERVQFLQSQHAETDYKHNMFALNWIRTDHIS